MSLEIPRSDCNTNKMQDLQHLLILQISFISKTDKIAILSNTNKRGQIVESRNERVGYTHAQQENLNSCKTEQRKLKGMSNAVLMRVLIQSVSSQNKTYLPNDITI